MELQLLMMCFLQNSSPYGLIQVYVKLEIQSFSVHFSVDIICVTVRGGGGPQILINVGVSHYHTILLCTENGPDLCYNNIIEMLAHDLQYFGHP